MTVRVVLPAHLRVLAKISGEVRVEAGDPPTIGSVIGSLEQQYPMLRGTIRDQQTQRRRPFIRFFACERDLSHQEPDTALPAPVAAGAEPLLVVGAIAGG